MILQPHDFLPEKQVKGNCQKSGFSPYPVFLLALNLWFMDSPGGSTVRNPPAMQEMQDTGHVSIPGSGRSPGEGNGNPLQYSCLENPMDRGAWRATVHGVAKSRTRWKGLGMHAHFGF